MTVINECPVKDCEEEAENLVVVNNDGVTLRVCFRHRIELLNGKKLMMVFCGAPGEWKGFISG